MQYEEGFGMDKQFFKMSGEVFVTNCDERKYNGMNENTYPLLQQF